MPYINGKKVLSDIRVKTLPTFEKIVDRTLTENQATIDITQDDNGHSFELISARIYIFAVGASPTQSNCDVSINLDDNDEKIYLTGTLSGAANQTPYLNAGSYKTLAIDLDYTIKPLMNIFSSCAGTYSAQSNGYDLSWDVDSTYDETIKRITITPEVSTARLGIGSRIVVMGERRVNETEQVTLTINLTERGAILFDNQDVTDTEIHVVDKGSTHYLRCEANYGNTFSHWLINGQMVLGNWIQTVIIPTADLNITAVFE